MKQIFAVIENLKANRSLRRWQLTLFLLIVLTASAISLQAQTEKPPSSSVVGPTPTAQTNQQIQPQINLSSTQFIDRTGLNVERLIETGFSKRTDLLAARQRLAIAQGRVVQAGLRPNPTLDAEYGSPKFLGGESETDLSVGVSQTFELGGKRKKRLAVAKLELAQARAEVAALERQLAAEIRAGYARAVAAGRQLDALERLIAANDELVRITNARLKEGDVAPLDLNLVRVETDRLRVQVVRTRAELESEIISLRTLAGFEQTEILRIAPQPDRPPRFELSLVEVTDIALRERQDLQAARIGEQLGDACISLAKSLATPNVSAGVRFSRSKQIVDLTERLGVGPARDTDNELTFGVSIEIPIFNRNQGEVASANAGKIQAQRQREFLEATIRRDVALAFRRYRASAEALVLYSTQILPRSQDNFRSVQAAYNLGEFSVFDVINEQRRLIESETGYNEALRDYYAALAELETALGTPLPQSAFAPPATSVLLDENMFRIEKNRSSKDAFLKTDTNKTTRTSTVFKTTMTSNKKENPIREEQKR